MARRRRGVNGTSSASFSSENNAEGPAPPPITLNAEGKADAEEGEHRCGRSTQSCIILGDDAAAAANSTNLLSTSEPRPPNHSSTLATVSFTSSISSARATGQDEPSSNVPPSPSISGAKRKRPQSPSKPSREERRLERNQREKERSNRVTAQVDALRCLLQRGGLFLPKNTRSTVLSEAGNYIRTLQDRQQLMSMEMEGLKRRLTESMAARACAFPPQEGGGPPAHGSAASIASLGCGGAGDDVRDYQLIFKNTMAGMAVASLGGALLDVNSTFQSSAGLPADRLLGMTIFNIVHPTDLPRALDLISRMIERGCSATAPVCADPSADAATCCNPYGGDAPDKSPNDEPVILRSSFRDRLDVGLCVTLVRGKDSVAKCFNITLVMNGPRTHGSVERGATDPVPFDPSLPILPSMASYKHVAVGNPSPSDRTAEAEGVNALAGQSLQADKGTKMIQNTQPGREPSQLAPLARASAGQGQPHTGWPLLEASPQEVSTVPAAMFRATHDLGTTSNAMGCAVFQTRSKQLEDTGGPAYYASG